MASGLPFVNYTLAQEYARLKKSQSLCKVISQQASSACELSLPTLTPSEYSSGARTRRGAITKAGPQLVRGALIEAAWSYRHRPAIGATLRRRQAGCAAETLARSWKAQQRLHATYAKLTRRGKIPSVAVTATARELAGFVWAEMTS